MTVEFEKSNSFESVFLISIFNEATIQFNSVIVKFSFEFKNLLINVSIQSFLEKKSELNKRTHIKDPLFAQSQISVLFIILSSIISQTSVSSAQDLFSSIFISQIDLFHINISQINIFQFIFFQVAQSFYSILSVTQKKSKKKEQKRVVKKAEMQSIVDLMNDFTKMFDKSVSIRNVLKQNKIDINFMNWIAWSSAACREIKRLCIRIFKKRTKKPVSVIIFQQFNQVLPPSYQYENQFFSNQTFSSQMFSKQSAFI